MITLLKTLYNKAEGLKGRRLVYTLVFLFVLFVLIGFAVGYVTLQRLNKDEKAQTDTAVVTKEPSLSEYEGKITYINPAFYPDDKISYVLVDASGKDIILLKSNDQKLSIAEGLYVKVRGAKLKTADGKMDVLNVKEVVIKSVTN